VFFFKRLSLVLLFISCLSSGVSFSYAQSSSGSLTISTYYPSPYGAYKRLKLIPSAETDIPACTSEIAGDMFFNQDKNQVVICKEKEPLSWDWEVMGGIDKNEEIEAQDFCITDDDGNEYCLSDARKMQQSQLLVGGMHTVGECEMAGGEVHDSDVATPLCKFNQGSPPAGWTQYKYWSACVPHKCTANCFTGTFVTSGAKSFSGASFQNRQPGQAHYCSRSDCPVIPYVATCWGGGGDSCCYSTRSQVGCY